MIVQILRRLVTMALTTFSYLFVFLSGGSIEMHFHFFMMMALLIVYLDWRLGWLVLLLVGLHHGVLNYVAPHWVYFYGRNDFSVIAHAIPVLATAIFTTVLCANNRQVVLRLRSQAQTEAERDEAQRRREEEQQKREELQRNVGRFLTVATDIAKGDLTQRGAVTADAWADPASGYPITFERHPAARTSPPPGLDEHAGEGFAPR